VLYFYIIKKNRNKQILTAIAALIIVMFGLILPYDSPIIAFLGDLGIDTRVVKMFQEGELFSFSNREVIYETAYEIISCNGTKVSGFFADRYYLRNFSMYSRWIEYPHNIFLEILLDFGIVVGTVLIAILLLRIVQSIIKSHDEKKIVVLMLVFLVMGRLFVSSSYMIEGLFYTMIYFIFCKLKKTRVIDEQE